MSTPSQNRNNNSYNTIDMKKLIIFATLVATLGLNAQAQWFDFSNNQHDFLVGLTPGVPGFGAGNSPVLYGNKPYAGLGVGVSISIMGIYLDCLVNGPDNKYDNHVRDEFVPDQRAFTVNFGYRIPILSWLRIAPIVGYSQTCYGVIDYSSVNVEVNSETSTGRIYHDFLPVEEGMVHEINFGGGIFIQPFKYVEISFIGTRRALYGGISLNIFDLSN